MTPPKCELVHFTATDGVELAGLLYEPRLRSTTAALFLHGNGGASVFHSRRSNALAEVFLRNGIAWLPFNNRGAELIKRLKKRRGGRSKPVMLGMTYERIREAVYDIDGAIDFLRSRGYRRIYLIGHSTGANKICVYHRRRRRNRATGYVLFGGADDMGLYYVELGEKRFHEALERCRTAIDKGRGDDLVPKKYSPWLLLSWKSLYDTINPDGDYNTFPFYEAMNGVRIGSKTLFREYRTIDKKTLVIYGSEDIFLFGDVAGAVEILKAQTRARRRFEFEIVEGADHGFHGMEDVLGERIAKWMKKGRA